MNQSEINRGQKNTPDKLGNTEDREGEMLSYNK